MSKEYKMLKADGFDNAVIGSGKNPTTGQDIVVYDYLKCLEILQERDGMEYDEAWEFMEFNVVGAYMGEGTPIFMFRSDMMDIDEHYEDVKTTKFSDCKIKF